MQNQYILTLVFILSSFISQATSSDSTKQIAQFHLGTANDLFQKHQKSDKYFSASFAAKVSHEVFDTKIARKVLFAKNNENSLFTLGIRQNGFTPENLTIAKVDSSDRPYAGTLTLSYLQTSEITRLHLKYLTALRLGVAGPLARIENVQTTIHTMTGSKTPQGWNNQIGNALIIQYAGMVQKDFLHQQKHLRLGIGGYGEFGSFFNYMIAFVNLKAGWFHQDYMNFDKVQYRANANMSKWQLYLNLYATESYVFYDGSLQGGLLPFKDSPYTMTWNDYEHNIPQLGFSITASYKNIQCQYWNVIEVDRYTAKDVFAFGAIGLFIPFGN